MPEERELKFEGGHWQVFINGLFQALETVFPVLASRLEGVDDSDMELVQGIIDKLAAEGGAEPGEGTTGDETFASFDTFEKAQANVPPGFEVVASGGLWTYRRKRIVEKPPLQWDKLEKAVAAAPPGWVVVQRGGFFTIEPGPRAKAEIAPARFVRGEDLPGGGPPGTYWIVQPNGAISEWKPPSEEDKTFDQKLAIMMGDAFGLPFDSPQWQAISLAIETRDRAISKGGISFAEAVRLAASLDVPPNEAERFISMLTNPLGQRATPPTAAPPSTFLEPESFQPSRARPAPFAAPSMIPLEQARKLQPQNFPVPGEGAIQGEGIFAPGGAAGLGVPFEDIDEGPLLLEEIRERDEARARLAAARVAFFPESPLRPPVGLQFDPQTGEPIPTPFGSALTAPPVPNVLRDTRLADQSLAGQRAALASLRNRMPTEQFQTVLAQAAKGEQVSPTSFPGPFIPAALAREFQFTTPEAARRGEIEAGTQAFQAAVATGEPEESVRSRFNLTGGNVKVFQGFEPIKTPKQEASEEIDRQRQRQKKQQAFVASAVPRVRFA